jgi:hypothetical protein
MHKRSQRATVFHFFGEGFYPINVLNALKNVAEVPTKVRKALASFFGPVPPFHGGAPGHQHRLPDSGELVTDTVKCFIL